MEARMTKVWEKLLDKLISKIWEDTPTDRLRQEVELLNEIYEWKRGAKENTPQNVGSFNREVVRYVKQIGKFTCQERKKFSTMMLRNANFTLGIIYAVNFQLNTKLSIKQTPKPRTEVYQATLTNLIQRVTYVLIYGKKMMPAVGLKEYFKYWQLM